MATSLSTCGLSSNYTGFLGPIRAHDSNGISIGAAVFAQTTAECPYTSQWDAPLPTSKFPISMGDLDPLSNAWFPGTTRVLNPNGIWISAAVFVGLTSVTDRQTDHGRYTRGR